MQLPYNALQLGRVPHTYCPQRERERERERENMFVRNYISITLSLKSLLKRTPNTGAVTLQCFTAWTGFSHSAPSGPIIIRNSSKNKPWLESPSNSKPVSLKQRVKYEAVKGGREQPCACQTPPSTQPRGAWLLVHDSRRGLLQQGGKAWLLDLVAVDNAEV